jgi:hypothetical protein
MGASLFFAAAFEKLEFLSISVTGHNTNLQFEEERPVFFGAAHSHVLEHEPGAENFPSNGGEGQTSIPLRPFFSNRWQTRWKVE